MAPPRAVTRSGSGYVLHLGATSGRSSSACSTSCATMLTEPPTTPDALARLFPVVHPDEPEQEAEYQRLMRDELVTSRLAGIDTVDGRARAAGPQGAARRGRDAGVRAGRQQHPPRARHGARRHRGRRGRPARRARRQPPSTTSTATCRGCSTRPCGRCPATSPLIWAGSSPTARLGGISPDAASTPPRSCGRGRTSRWNGTGPVLTSRCSQPDEAPLPPSSSGLGHHPFKVAARVRIPLGVRTYMPLVPW